MAQSLLQVVRWVEKFWTRGNEFGSSSIDNVLSIWVFENQYGIASTKPRCDHEFITKRDQARLS